MYMTLKIDGIDCQMWNFIIWKFKKKNWKYGPIKNI